MKEVYVVVLRTDTDRVISGVYTDLRLAENRKAELNNTPWIKRDFARRQAFIEPYDLNKPYRTGTETLIREGLV